MQEPHGFKSFFVLAATIGVRAYESGGRTNHTAIPVNHKSSLVTQFHVGASCLTALHNDNFPTSAPGRQQT